MPSMTPRTILFRDEARARLLAGVNTIADVVGATMGCGGRNILIDDGPFRPPRSSRDGVTVAKYVALADPIQNLGAQLIYQAAKKAADTAGDGTTTATILAQRLFADGCRLVAAGANPVHLRRGIDQAVEAICGKKAEEGEQAGRYIGGILAALTIPVTSPEQIRQVGTLSANSDPALGAMIAEALAQVGKDGTVTVEESQGTETALDVVEGMQFDRGYLSPYFVTDPDRMEAELAGDESAPVFLLLHEKPLRDMHQLIPVAAQVAQAGGSLLVVAEDVTDSALAWLVVNKLQGKFRSVAVKAPGFGDRRRSLLDDLAVLTGATVLSPELGLKMADVPLAMLGRAKRVTVSKDDCTVVGGMGDESVLEARRNDLRDQIARTASDYDRVRLEERLARLTGGVAVVKVGGQTEAEMKERKDRAEDAMYATRAAVAEGIVPGGGTALVRCVDSSEFRAAMATVSGDVQAGWRLVQRAAEEPLRRIVGNAGGEGGEVVAELRRRLLDGHATVTVGNAAEEKITPDGYVTVVAGNAAGEEMSLGIPGYGYNAATGQFTDLLSEGVIDPARVTRTALQAAGSVAGLLLTNDAVLADDVEAAAEVRKSLQPVMPAQQQMLQY